MKVPLFASAVSTFVLSIGVVSTAAQPVITEFMASNTTTLFDEDRQSSDWIEIHNPGPDACNLNGWYLTDSAKKLTKWMFPSVEIPGGGYLVVFASGKDRRDPARPLHTNFSLEASGEYLALVQPDGVTLASEFAPAFPAQPVNVSYGVAGGSTAFNAFNFLVAPTPAAPNTGPRFDVAEVAAPAPTPIAASLAPFSSRLPVIVIDNFGAGQLVKDDVAHPAAIQLYRASPMGLATFAQPPQLSSSATVSVRGSSSAEFPKKSYTLTLRDSFGNKRAESLLDLPAASSWALVAPWQYDLSYINNALVYALSERLGQRAPRTRFVEVFLHSRSGAVEAAEYAGIYVLTDRIDVSEQRMALREITSADNAGPGVTGGYIFKIDHPAATDFAWQTQRSLGPDPLASVVLITPEADDVTAAQVDYLRTYLQQMEDALAADLARGWAQRTHLAYIDRASWIDHHLLNTFAANPDAFTRSAYFMKDRGGKLKAGPVWDFDRSLGSYWDERSYRWDVWSGLGGTDVWNTGWWAMITRDPEFMQAWIDRWQQLRRNELSDAALRDLASTLAGTIGAEAAARDAARWPANTSPYGSHAAQIAQLKSWLTQRAGWIDEQFLRAPMTTLGDKVVTFTPPAGAELIFTRDGSDPRSLGGAVAPNAERSTSPLTVPMTANVHVRSYRAELDGIFPGSPWSAAVATDTASPLSPRGRLVNLSSRAVVNTQDESLVIGVAVADAPRKTFLARAVGPSLANFGVAGYAPDTQLSVFNGAGAQLFRNNGWQSSEALAEVARCTTAVGAFPLNSGSSDSALVNDLSTGTSTLQIESRVPGVTLAELYEVDDIGRISNVSTRAMIRSSDSGLVGGFVVSGPAYQRVLIRAVGSTLRELGVERAITDPELTVYSGWNVVAKCAGWSTAATYAATQKAAAAVGAFKLSNEATDCALLLTLAPGAYTIEIKSRSNAEGVTLLEIYDVP